MIYSSNLHPASRSIGTPFQPFLRETTEDISIILTNGDEHFIKAGFETDLGSVPRWLWSWVSPWGRTDLGFVCHDYLLVYFSDTYEREFIDLQMKEFHKLVGVDRFNMKSLYLGVSLYTMYKKLLNILLTK